MAHGKARSRDQEHGRGQNRQGGFHVVAFQVVVGNGLGWDTLSG
jgi:hypothetical protein